MANILVTGASGFIGRHLCARLAAAGHSLRLAVRSPLNSHDPLPALGELIVIGEVDGMTDWSFALDGVALVVHLANRAHVMREKADDPLAIYRQVNVDGTDRLASQSAAAGVRLLVYLSSVKVLGERTQSAPFDDQSPCNPQDPYAQSKWEAERVLENAASTSGMHVTALRPPLVYGPGVGANFLHLMKWIERGIPLPLAAARNCRSMIYVGNLADAILACLENSGAAGKSYLVSDGVPVSTAGLVKQLAAALNVKDRSWPLSPFLLQGIASALGKGDMVRRLTESLAVDDRAIRQDLGWTPRFSLNDGLRRTADWFHAQMAGSTERNG